MRTKLALICAVATGAGCAALVMPQDAKEFRARMPEKYIEKFEVKRPFRTVSDVVTRKSKECLDVTVTRRGMVYNGPYQFERTYHVKYHPTMQASATKAELVLRVDEGNPKQIIDVNKIPEGGMYVYVFDLFPAGGNTTRVELYGAMTMGPYKDIPEAIKGWMRGTDMACPKLP
jgi:hypothetical protein